MAGTDDDAMLTWNVTEIGKYYYACKGHPGMGGEIIVIDNETSY